MPVIQLEARKPILLRRRNSAAALPVLRAAQQAPAPVPHFVDVVGRNMQIGEIEHHVILRVFGILHGAEHGVGAAVQHDVKEREVCVALITERRAG